MKISDEAVYAAAFAVYGSGFDGSIQKEAWLSDFRKALEAAAPFVAADALEDAAYAFEGLPMNKGASISSGTWDWFELFPIQHIRDRAEDIRGDK